MKHNKENGMKKTIVITMDGGVVRDVCTDAEADVVIMDFDTEGADLADDSRYQIIDGDLVWVSVREADPISCLDENIAAAAIAATLEGSAS